MYFRRDIGHRPSTLHSNTPHVEDDAFRESGEGLLSEEMMPRTATRDPRVEGPEVSASLREQQLGGSVETETGQALVTKGLGIRETLVEGLGGLTIVVR